MNLRYTSYWHSAMFILLGIVSMVTLTIPSVEAAGDFKVSCDFGTQLYRNRTSYITNGSLTSHFGDARSCKVSHNISQAIIRVTLTRKQQNISVIYSVVMEQLQISFVGTAHDDDLMGEGYQFYACPINGHMHSSTELGIFLFGAPDNATFGLNIDLDDTYLTSGQTKTIELQKNDYQGQVLAFDVHQDSLFKLLQISASSEDADTVCYLMVSRSCARVQRQILGTAESKEMELKLTFTKFGQITLSQYSLPKIETGRWYIGVLVRDVVPGSTIRKAVNISVKHSYQYDSYGKGLPAGYMCLIAIIFGIAIAVFAHFFLNSDFDEMAPPKVEGDDTDTENEHVLITDFIPQPIPRRHFPCKRWAQVVFVRWFSKGLKTFSYLTAVLAIAFLVGSAQFVIGRWSNMITSGDRDKCYYNEKCYRPIAFADLPSNFMVSNVPYVIHGVILALSFSLREAIALDFINPKRSLDISVKHLVVPYDFSLAYALSWALVFEGIFSATYHLCPSRLTFQFDSAFMFIISGLVIIALYNSRIKRVVDNNVDPDNDSRPPDQTIVQAPKFFLFFVAPLLVLNYVGSIRDTEGLPAFVEGVYWLFLVVWIVFLYIWAFKKIGAPCRRDIKCCSTAENALKWFWLILFPICLLLIGVTKFGDWSQFFLFACVAAVALSIMALLTLNLSIAVRRVRAYDAVDGIHPLRDIKSACMTVATNFHRVLFSFILFLFWVFAMYFFKLKPVTKKTAPPSYSRTLNHDCVLWDFFDYHDIWHMLSSFALFMSAYLLIYICRKVEKYYWVEACYLKHKHSTYTNKDGPEGGELKASSEEQATTAEDINVDVNEGGESRALVV